MKLPVIRTIEDVVLVAGTAVTTWQATGSVVDVVAAVSVAPAVRSGIALILSGKRSSGLVEALRILAAALAGLETHDPKHAA